MSRYLVTLHTAADRARLIQYVSNAMPGSRVELKGPRRSLPQNDRMWAMLTDISEQIEHPHVPGLRLTPAKWKDLCLQAFGKEVEFVPSIDGTELVPIGQRSSELSKEEMSSFMEWLSAFGTERGVKFHDPRAFDPKAPIEEEEAA